MNISSTSPRSFYNDSSGDGGELEEKPWCLSRLSTAQLKETQELSSTFGKFCGVMWDGFNCWGPAAPNSTMYLACPAAKGMDVTKQAFRLCDASGSWLGKDGLPDEKGWTNYTACFTPEIFALIKRLYTGSESEVVMKIDIARRTRILETFGLSVSFLALLFSLCVFCYFRSLRNPRTKLHRNLFIAVLIQVAVRLTLYIDQFIVRSHNLVQEEGPRDDAIRGIDNTPILCEAAYICLEYARTAMFMWMFVEGLYLHNMITVNVFEHKLSPVFPLVGWIFPIPLTFGWAVVTAKHYGTATCWWGYNFTINFWILEGPRLGVLVVNLIFLLNILRVLVTKLRQSNSSEALQARKAVKAALVLLPLLGLPNLLNILDAPLERSALEFGIWSYTTHALSSLQGVILAGLYCFWNAEVQLALKKFFRFKFLAKLRRRSDENGRICSTSDKPLGKDQTVVRMSMLTHVPQSPYVPRQGLHRTSTSITTSSILPQNHRRLELLANCHKPRSPSVKWHLPHLPLGRDDPHKKPRNPGITTTSFLQEARSPPGVPIAQLLQDGNSQTSPGEVRGEFILGQNPDISPSSSPQALIQSKAREREKELMRNNNNYYRDKGGPRKCLSIVLRGGKSQGKSLSASSLVPLNIPPRTLQDPGKTREDERGTAGEEKPGRMAPGRAKRRNFSQFRLWVSPFALVRDPDCESAPEEVRVEEEMSLDNTQEFSYLT